MKAEMMTEWKSIPIEQRDFYFDLFNSHAKGSSVLLIGTGFNLSQYCFWPTVLESLGTVSVEYLEICEDYCKKWANKEYPVRHGNVLDIKNIYGKNSFDIVFWSQGPEHIKHELMKQVFDDLFDISKSLLLLTCPFGSYYDGEEACYGNEYERHIQKNLTPDSFSDINGFNIKTIGEKDRPDGVIAIWKTR